MEGYRTVAGGHMGLVDGGPLGPSVAGVEGRAVKSSGIQDGTLHHAGNQSLSWQNRDKNPPRVVQ